MPTNCYFFGHTKENGCFSNFYPHAFTYDGVKLPTSEHHMMRMKAKLMGDVGSVANIEKAKQPLQAKQLGRKITPWNEGLWAGNRLRIVSDIVLAKFKSSKELTKKLLAYDGHFYECSPKDRIWGIGLTVEAAKNGEPHKGENLLGRALDEVRDHAMAAAMDTKM